MRRASDRDLDIECDVGDMHTLPYKDGSFDHVFAYLPIGHTDSDGIRKVISEIGRVLVPNGTVFLTLCSKDTWTDKDVVNANRCIEHGAEIVEKALSISRISEDLMGKPAIAAKIISSSVKRIAEYSMDICETAINAAME